MIHAESEACIPLHTALKVITACYSHSYSTPPAGITGNITTTDSLVVIAKTPSKFTKYILIDTNMIHHKVQYYSNRVLPFHRYAYMTLKQRKRRKFVVLHEVLDSQSFFAFVDFSPI